MDCIKGPCGKNEVKAKTKLKNGTLGQKNLEKTLEEWLESDFQQYKINLLLLALGHIARAAATC